MENPPTEGGWTTTIRDTSSHLVFQKKSNIKELSIKTHGGMWTRDATYQMQGIQGKDVNDQSCPGMKHCVDAKKHCVDAKKAELCQQY